MAERPETTLITAGRDPEANHGIVNTPIYHASTVTFPSAQALREATAKPFDGVYYGRHGTPTTFAFEEAVAALDSGYSRAVSTSSGLASITTAMLTLVESGDHILVADSVYGPTRSFCDETLTRLGITTEYYDPLIADGIADLIRPNTRLVFCESPGSLTFEVQDIPAIVAAAHAAGCQVLLDNTWATPLFFRAHEHGVDICIHAATKYLVGHADAMLGVITTSDEAGFLAIKRTAVRLGQCAGPDACWLGLRGMRSLAARLARHQESTMVLASWLQQQPSVEGLLYPALENDQGYRLWQRDFSGATGLFGVVLKTAPQAAVDALVDGMQYFALGYSWGGYESLILPANGGIQRNHLDPEAGFSLERPVLRIHVGLEAVSDLQDDLAAGLARFEKSLVNQR